jgi:hypothetical protein
VAGIPSRSCWGRHYCIRRHCCCIRHTPVLAVEVRCTSFRLVVAQKSTEEALGTAGEPAGLGTSSQCQRKDEHLEPDGVLSFCMRRERRAQRLEPRFREEPIVPSCTNRNCYSAGNHCSHNNMSRAVRASTCAQRKQGPFCGRFLNLSRRMELKVVALRIARGQMGGAKMMLGMQSKK